MEDFEKYEMQKNIDLLTARLEEMSGIKDRKQKECIRNISFITMVVVWIIGFIVIMCSFMNGVNYVAIIASAIFILTTGIFFAISYYRNYMVDGRGLFEDEDD